ncbi:protein PALE CRESS, chloroplastic-like [Quercus robur]|uniref:protein PALE CRESS, chloroplastic-like n=1 Tax=Quercus robur TaxID=38942 RepID=UPI002161B6D9|nr:protein PALE CRESS, chloroplastic-like [Quercus robur]
MQEIEEAAEKGELNELVLMIICNCLDFARLDDEMAVRNLDLLYRRVEEATPAMRLLNDLLNMHDGFDDEGWLKEFKNRMVDTFPRENLFSVLVLAGNEINKLCFKCTLYMSYGFS